MYVSSCTRLMGLSKGACSESLSMWAIICSVAGKSLRTIQHSTSFNIETLLLYRPHIADISHPVKMLFRLFSPWKDDGRKTPVTFTIHTPFSSGAFLTLPYNTQLNTRGVFITSFSSKKNVYKYVSLGWCYLVRHRLPDNKLRPKIVL